MNSLTRFLVLFLGIASLTSAAGDRLAAEAIRPELRLPRSPDYDYEVPEPGSYQLPVIKPAADGVLIGPGGAELSLHDLVDGRITVLSFIYTRCQNPRACLRASGVLRQLQQLSRLDEPLASQLRLLTLSFDPAHDDPAVMSRYGRVVQGSEDGALGADWFFLTTRGERELQPLLQAFGQRVDRRPAGDVAGPLSHPLRVYLIDGHRRIRNIYNEALLDPRLVMTDVRTLLLEQAKLARNGDVSTPGSSIQP